MHSVHVLLTLDVICTYLRQTSLKMNPFRNKTNDATRDSSEKLLSKDEELVASPETAQWEHAPAKKRSWERIWHFAAELLLLLVIVALIATEKPRSAYSSQITYSQ